MLRSGRRAALAAFAVASFALAPSALAGPPVAQEQGQDAEARLDALIKRWDTANEEFIQKYRAVETNEERKALMESRPKVADYLPEAVEIAESAAGTPVAVRAWMWVLQNPDRAKPDAELAQVAIEALLRDHADSKEIVELPVIVLSSWGSLGADAVEGILRDLMQQAPAGAFKGNALYALAMHLDADDLDPDSDRGKEVRGLMEAVAKGYADVKDSRGRSIGKRAEGWLFEKDHLQVGMPAPEIEAADLSGVAFKLSDYRGKVVLLDFWGNW